MPGFEFFGAEERKQVHDVLETGVLMRYGFDGMRNNHWKAKEFEKAFAERMGSDYCQLVSSGTAALTVALASAGIGAGDPHHVIEQRHSLPGIKLAHKRKGRCVA